MRSKFRTMLVALGAVLALFALTAASALASGSPSVETKPATNITETGATLNGVVNPNGAATKYYFEYGTTTGYGKKTAEVSAGSGTKTLEESAAITGLTINTTYHFRIVATSTNGTSDGADSPINTETTKFELAWHQSREYQGEEEFMSYENEKGELVRTEFTVNTGPGQLRRPSKFGERSRSRQPRASRSARSAGFPTLRLDGGAVARAAAPPFQLSSQTTV
jgi:hypothetical protein